MKQTKRARQSEFAATNVVVFTPIEVEFRAVADMMIEHRHYYDAQFGVSYQLGTLPGYERRLRIALRLGGKEEIEATKVVYQIMQLCQPKVLILFGTAGTLKGHQVGDIIIGKVGYSYEVGRVMDGATYSSPRVGWASPRLVALANRLQREEEQWHPYLPFPNQKPTVKTGPIVSGNKVLQSLTAPLIRQIRERFDDALAVEMEAYGFFDAANAYPGVEAINIRGVADYLADKKVANKQGSKEIAVGQAAAFLRYFLQQLFEDEKPVLWRRIGIATATLLLLLMVFAFIPISKTASQLGAFPVGGVGNEKAQANTNVSSQYETSNRSELTIEEVGEDKYREQQIITEEPGNLPTNEITDTATNKLAIDAPAIGKDSQEFYSEGLPLQAPLQVGEPDEKKGANKPDVAYYILSIHVFLENGQRLRAGQATIDDEPYNLGANQLRLPQGKHTLTITINNETSNHSFTVSESSDKQLDIFLDR